LRESVILNSTNSNIGLNIFNYSNLVGNKDFEKFRCQVENANVTGFNETQFKAFWINVYNYMAISIVFEHSCNYDLFGNCSALTSIRQIGQQQPGVFKTVTWDMPWLTMTTGNESTTYSLNDVEHGKLRCPPNDWPEDVRIHAAIVCASVSCPNIRNSAYLNEYIDDNLTNAITDFFSYDNRKKGVDVIDNQLWVSQIFSFFPEDFDNTTKPLKMCSGKVKPTNSFNVSWLIRQYAPSNIVNWTQNNPDKSKYENLNFLLMIGI